MAMAKRVLVGMSGGVDSSVAAALLIEQGYEVTGVTLRLWAEDNESERREGGCCSLDDIDDARRVCHRLGIRHLVLNMKEQFKTRVVDYFINEYITGRTPNPCIACNRHIKFDEMLRRAKLLEYDYIATGHYAQISLQNGRYQLHRAAHPEKDQSYALYTLTQAQLPHLLLPLGEYSKERVRLTAKEKELAVFSKPDSQEICFVPDNNYARFLERSGAVLPGQGDFIDRDGNILGRHNGYWRYTYGQRKGLGVTFGKPMFVTGINPRSNTVTLGESGEEYRSRFDVSGINYIAFEPPREPFKCAVKLRYSAIPAACTVYPQVGNRAVVELNKPGRAVTPGQAAVFYDGGRVLCGGTIESPCHCGDIPL